MAYTDQLFLLLTIVVELCLLVLIAAGLAKMVNCYVTQFEFDTIKSLLVLMMPIYFFQILEQALFQNPLPLWFEGLAYVTVVLLILLAIVAMIASGAMKAMAKRRSVSMK